jgi:hypothetical protein
MSPALAVYVAAQLCHGLGFAHARVDPATGQPLGIVHRDVSPQNVLIGFDGTVKLADFGIAKVADQRSQTLSGTVKGKHPYMSPEQAMGEAIDARTDLFALATVLYEVLTRRRLFKRENDVKTLEAVARCDVPAPSRVQGELPGALDAVLLKALARERDERFANAAALRTALEGAVPLASTAATELGRLATALFPERVARFAQLQAPPPLAPLYPPLAHDLKTERMAPVTAGDDPPTLRPEDPTLPPGTPALTEPSPRAQRETVTRPRAARPGATASASFDARAPLPPLGQPARPQTSTQTALTPTPGRARWLWPVVAALAGALGLAALAVLGAAAMGSDAPQPVACAATLHVGADAGVFVHSAAGVGTSFRLYGADGGAPAGVAMVIEALPGDEARLLTENPAALQPGMTACPLTTN